MQTYFFPFDTTHTRFTKIYAIEQNILFIRLKSRRIYGDKKFSEEIKFNKFQKKNESLIMFCPFSAFFTKFNW